MAATFGVRRHPHEHGNDTLEELRGGVDISSGSQSESRSDDDLGGRLGRRPPCDSVETGFVGRREFSRAFRNVQCHGVRRSAELIAHVAAPGWEGLRHDVDLELIRITKLQPAN